MPLSQFGKPLQTVVGFLPGTYGTALLRNHAMKGVFSEMLAQGIPADAVDAIRNTVDCNLYFFGNKVPVSAMYAVLTFSAAAGISSSCPGLHQQKAYHHMLFASHSPASGARAWAGYWSTSALYAFHGPAPLRAL